MNNLFYPVLIISVLFSCKKKEDSPAPAQQITQMVSNSSDTLKKGVFTGYQHNLSGEALIIQDNTKPILRFTNYNMTSGPNVDVLLSKSASYSGANSIKISDLDGSFTNSSINFDLPPSINWAEYPYVIVWCTDYSVNFGTAQLLNP